MTGISRQSREHFERKVVPYLDELYSAALEMTHDQAAAQDLVSRTLAKAYGTFVHLPPDIDPREWLLRLLLTTYADLSGEKRPAPATDAAGISCAEVLDRIYAYLDGELSDADAAIIRQHLDECGPCLREYGLEEAVKRVVRQAAGDDKVSPQMRQKVLSRIRAIQDEEAVGAVRDYPSPQAFPAGAASGDREAIRERPSATDIQQRVAGIPGYSARGWPGPSPAWPSGAFAAPEVRPVRHLTAALPERAAAGRRISLLVRVTLGDGAADRSAALPSLDVPPDGRAVTITVSAPGLVPLGDLEQDLQVPAGRDSDPIRFGFRTGRAGLHSVLVTAFASGTFLGELALQVSVEVGADLEEGPSRAIPLTGLAAEPGEVTLQVSRTDDDRYSFQLLGEALYPVELSKRLAGDPSDVVGALVAELRAMAAGESPFTTAALVRNRIRNLGAQLWADAVPESIRRQFWAQADRIKLFTVASDTDTVPWELLYPVDGGNDNGFLVEQFPVVRRVYGQSRVRSLPLTSAAYIVPPNSPANAMEEVQAIRTRLGPGLRDQGVIERLDSLITLLDGVPSLLHFACHNQFTDRAGSSITLAGGPLRPSDLAVAVQQRSLSAASPLVFFNACRTAGEIPGLTQMMGWAKQFMGAGAGAFVGSLWAVRSTSARTFADAFYQALVTERAPLGAAARQARKAIADDTGDPTWLAYTVYGNPSATVADG